MSKLAKPSNYYPLIDLVRFLAALSVLLFHLGYSSWQERSSALSIVQGAYSIPEGIIYWFGWVGVQIFFVISGFVIANSASHSSPLNFVKGRMVRLYPAAWICGIISALVATTLSLYGNSELIERTFKSLILSPKGPWIEGVYWTLALEIFFYGLIFLLVLSKRIHKIDVFAHALTLYSAMFIIILLMSREGVFLIDGIEQFRTGIGKKLLMWHGVFFTVGLYIWLWSKDSLSGPGYFFAPLALSACCLQIYLGVQSPDALGIQLSPEEQSVRSWEYPVIFFLLCVTAIPLAVVIKKQKSKAYSHVNYICKKLGAATYPLYLVHFSLGISLTKLFTTYNLSPHVAFYISALFMIILSLFICTYLEPPLKSKLSFLLDKALLKFRGTSASSSAR